MTLPIEFTAEGDRVFWSGIFHPADEMMRVLAAFRSTERTDWFHREANELADQLEAALIQAGHLQHKQECAA